MLFATIAPEAKRARLRERLGQGRILRFPGAFSPLVAMLVEELGFDGVYVSGAALSADLGMPDVGLTTLGEVAGRGHQIARATDLPAIVDADTGFGEPMNVARTIRELEDLGLAGCHIEDQVSPKRCGHLSGKTLVSTEAMVRKVRAAADARRDPGFLLVVRTDARAVEGLEGAVRRSRAYIDAGADVIFPEALADAREFEAFRASVTAPLLANMTEFGASPLLGATELEALGYDIVIYPVTTLRLAMQAVEDGLRTLRDEGSQRSITGSMQPRSRLYELLRYARYEELDSAVYDFLVDQADAS